MRPSYINYCLISEVSIRLHCQLCSTCYTAFRIKNCFYNPRISKERNSAAPPNYINYRLKSEVSIMHCCRLCSTRYTAVRIKNCLKSTSAIKIATMKSTDNFCFKGKSSCATAKSTPFAVSKDEWHTKE